MPPEELNAVVSQRIELHPALVILRIVPDGWELRDFTPGQYATIGLPPSAPRCESSDPEAEPPPDDRLIKRAYSIASSSKAREYLEVYVSLVTSGSLTPRLFALRPGDRLFLAPRIVGVFTLERAPADKHLILIATGTGLAPYMSMLRTVLDCGGPRRIAIIHGSRHSWDLGYRSELTTYQRLCSNFLYIPTITAPDREPARWTGRTGRVQQIWEARAIDEAWGFPAAPDNARVFLCGNPQMVEQMIATLTGQGWTEHSRKTPGEIFTEKYW